jgi:hypothetical protein
MIVLFNAIPSSLVSRFIIILISHSDFLIRSPLTRYFHYSALARFPTYQLEVIRLATLMQIQFNYPV